jgi:hypothetical protein
MILIWRGAGILVAIIGVIAAVAGYYLAGLIFGENVAGNVRGLVIGWLAALLTLPLAYLLRRPSTPFTGKSDDPEAIRYEPHDLFFIPLTWWPVLYFLIGTAFYFAFAARGRL